MKYMGFIFFLDQEASVPKIAESKLRENVRKLQVKCPILNLLGSFTYLIISKVRA